MRPVLWASAALLYASAAAAQQVPAVLTLADAVRLAEERNPALQAARNATDAARADTVTARALPNPALTFESEGRSIFRSPPDDGHEYSVRLDQDLLLGSRRRLQITGAETGVAVADARY
jgi:cobalt-zinc-cadmium efflux system outer membrane protein